jgi:hypothetical protein
MPMPMPMPMPMSMLMVEIFFWIAVALILITYAIISCLVFEATQSEQVFSKPHRLMGVVIAAFWPVFLVGLYVWSAMLDVGKWILENDK